MCELKARILMNSAFQQFHCKGYLHQIKTHTGNEKNFLKSVLTLSSFMGFKQDPNPNTAIKEGVNILAG